MKVKRETINKELENVILEYVSDKKVVSKVLELLAKQNISPDFTLKVLNLNIPLMSIDDLEISLILLALHTATNDSRVNPERYLSGKELIMAKTYKKNEEQVSSNQIVFHNVVPLGDELWSCPAVEWKYLVECYKGTSIEYNTNTQRRATRKKNDFGGFIEVPRVIKTKVAEIEALMEKGKFYPNEITLNVPYIAGDEAIFYDAKAMTLTIEVDESTRCQIIDGYHRLMGAIRVVGRNPNFKLKTNIKVGHFSIEDAQNLIVQEDKKTPIGKALRAKLDNQNKYVLMAKSIASYGNETTNEMFGRMTEDNEGLKMGKYVTYETFVKALEINFPYSAPREGEAIKQYLISGFNEIIGIFQKEFMERLNESREQSIIAHSNTFFGYVALLSAIYQNENWRKKLERILKSLDWSIGNPVWLSHGILHPKVSDKTARKLSEYFKTIVEAYSK